MNILDRKIELFEAISGKSSKWLKAWKVILIILMSFAGLNILFALFSVNIFGVIWNGGMFTLYLMAFLKLNTCENAAYGLNLAINIIQIVSYSFSVLISLICTISFASIGAANIEEFIYESSAAYSSEVSQVLSMIAPILVIFFVVWLIFSAILLTLYIMNLIYFKNRKMIFSLSIDELAQRAGQPVQASAPYVNPQNSGYQTYDAYNPQNNFPQQGQQPPMNNSGFPQNNFGQAQEYIPQIQQPPVNNGASGDTNEIQQNNDENNIH